MQADLTSSLIINFIVLIIAIAIVIKGKSLRAKKSSSGISASSNETSTGTALISWGLVLGFIQISKLIAAFL